MDGSYFKEIKQMGITHKDFFRLLPRAMGENEFSLDGLIVRAKLSSGTLVISVGEENQRVLSPNVIMPYADVTFEYHDVLDSIRTEFEQYFHLRFMRGLG